MKNLKQIDIKGYTIVEDNKNSEFKFGLLTDDIIFFEVNHRFAEETFFEDLHDGINIFENMIVKDILSTHLYRMETNGFKLDGSQFQDDLEERVRNAIDFDSKDWDANFKKAGFALAPLFTRDEKSVFKVNESYHVDLMKNIPMFIVEGEV